MSSDSSTNFSISSSRPLRLGVVGCGQISRILLPLLSRDEWEVTGATDTYRPAARDLLSMTGEGKVFATVDALLAEPDIDVVYLATPPGTHLALLRSCLEAGKHVICEKPFMISATQARTAAHLAESHSACKIGICSARFRLLANAARVRLDIREGRLGRLRHLRMFGNYGPPDPLANQPRWKSDLAMAGGGMVMDWCVYELEWLQFVLGTLFSPVSVYTILNDWGREGTSIESGYEILMRCPGDLSISISRQPEIAPPVNRVEIRGQSGSLDLALTPPTRPDQECSLRHHYWTEETTTVETREVAEFESDWKEALTAPLSDLRESILTNRETIDQIRSQIQLHEILDAILLSGRTRQEVLLNGNPS